MLKDDRVLVTGIFYTGGNSQASAEIFDSAKNSFVIAAGNFDSIRLFSTATLLENGKVLIVGGYNQNIEVSKQA